ncbi:hypothetical protein Tco_1244988 [Tanacetum coccineum]
MSVILDVGMSVGEGESKIRLTVTGLGLSEGVRDCVTRVTEMSLAQHDFNRHVTVQKQIIEGVLREGFKMLDRVLMRAQNDNKTDMHGDVELW